MLTEPDSITATSGNAKKTAADAVEVSKVDLPCTDGNAVVTDLPFGDKVTLPTTATKDATVKFTFETDGSVKTVEIN